MIRPWHTWSAFVICLLVVLTTLGWISLTVLRLDRAEAEARRQAEVEESIRLALWRMDSALGPMIAQESRHPYFAYQSFYPAERAYTHMFSEIQPGEVMLPSPLLAFDSPSILLHFQWGPDGQLTSPQVATGTMCDVAESAYVSHEKLEASRRRLEELKELLDKDALVLFAALPKEELPKAAPRPAVAQPTLNQPVQELSSSWARRGAAEHKPVFNSRSPVRATIRTRCPFLHLQTSPRERQNQSGSTMPSCWHDEFRSTVRPTSRAAS